MIALAVLAAAAAAVSYQAQYQLVAALKHDQWAAAVQAAIPDAGAAVFACLGIALALQGKRAIRTRVLNLACVGISVAMNALAVVHGGWRSLAVWVMAPAIYALASDTLIGVVRAWSIARHRELSEALADDEATPIATLGGLLLWLLRLSLAPKSTLAGFRSWVVEECPVAPGRRVVSASGSDRRAAHRASCHHRPGGSIPAAPGAQGRRYQDCPFPGPGNRAPRPAGRGAAQRRIPDRRRDRPRGRPERGVGPVGPAAARP